MKRRNAGRTVSLGYAIVSSSFPKEGQNDHLVMHVFCCCCCYSCAVGSKDGLVAFRKNFNLQWSGPF